MKLEILFYFAIANYVCQCAKISSKKELRNLISTKEKKLQGYDKHWRTPKDVKRADINHVAHQLQLKLARLRSASKKPEHRGSSRSRSRTISEKKTNTLKNNAWKTILNKLREGHKSSPPVRGQTPPRVKFIARSKPIDSDSVAVNGPQDLNGEVYGNLDNLGITYGKTRQRVMYSSNRRNKPQLRIKTKQHARTNNPDDIVSENQIASNEDSPPNRISEEDFNNDSESDEHGPTNSLSSEDINKNSEDIRSEDPLPKVEIPSEGKISRNVGPHEDTPKSAFLYPNNPEPLVYGNLDNLGITYGKTKKRILYSSNRRNSVLDSILRLLTHDSNTRQRSKTPLIVAFYTNGKKKNMKPHEEINQMDESAAQGVFLPMLSHTRRQKDNNTKKDDSEDSDDDSSSSGSDYEFNKQNPYTVHKDRYLQNFLWNHEMTGDHVNMNPYAPRFGGDGATGAELHWSRKWWYFNQDDFVPLG